MKFHVKGRGCNMENSKNKIIVFLSILVGIWLCIPALNDFFNCIFPFSLMIYLYLGVFAFIIALLLIDFVVFKIRYNIFTF